MNPNDVVRAAEQFFNDVELQRQFPGLKDRVYLRIAGEDAVVHEFKPHQFRVEWQYTCCYADFSEDDVTLYQAFQRLAAAVETKRSELTKALKHPAVLDGV